MKFVFLKGTLKGKKIETDQSVITIGSDKSNLLVIGDPGISSRHVYIEKLDDQWMLIDAKSTNGVYINGEKVEHKSNLTDYDTIKLAEVEFVVLMSSEATAPVLKKPVVTFASGKKQPAEAVEITQKYSSNDKVLRETKGQKNKGLSKTISLIAFIVVVLIACFVGRKGLNHTSMAVNTEIVQAETSQEVAAPKVDVKQTPERDVKKKNKTVVVAVSEEAQEVEIAVKPEKIVVAKPKPRHGDLVYDFTEKHCFSCHNENKQKGKVRVDDNDFFISSHSSVYRWQDILDALNAGDMPPEDEKQPSKDELSGVIGELTDRLQKARAKLASTGGAITIRHLNRQDYSGSIVDLFGADLHTNDLPLDSPEGLDTDGSEQFFTTNHKKIYFEKGLHIVRSAIVAISEKKNLGNFKRRHDPEDNGRRSREFLKRVDPNLDIEKYRTYSQKELVAAMKKKFPDKLGRILVPRAITHLLDKHIDKGSYGRVLGNYPLAPGQKYKLTFATFGNTSETAPVLFRHGIYEKFPINLKFDSSKNLHMTSMYVTGKLLLGKHRVRDEYSKNHRLAFEVSTPKGGYVDYFLLEPIETEKSHFENCFESIISKKSITDNELTEAFTKFCQRAFRNIEPAKDFIESLVKQCRSEIEFGVAPNVAILTPLATVLSSTSFLYLKEYSNGLRTEMPTEDYANRLAYFLWGAPPSDALIEIAKSGQLKSPRGLAKQILKMLKVERSDLALENFFAQWFELDRLDQIGLRDEFGESVRKEPLKFFKYLVNNNLPLDNLIDSDFIVINRILAKHYGIKGDFEGFQPVKLPKDSKRGGLLTQVAFLAMGSDGVRTSPTIRGTIIRSKFLHDEPAPPPPNVPQLDTQDDGTKTVRQLVDLHKEVPQCFSCHDKIDPVGYGLEHFDKLGKFRETVRVKKRPDSDRKDRHNLKIDASGYLDKSHTFDDSEGFKSQLMKQKDKLARSMFESLLAHGMGRKIEFIDEAEIDACLKRLKKRNYRMQEMIFEVVNSKAFRSK